MQKHSFQNDALFVLLEKDLEWWCIEYQHDPAVNRWSVADTTSLDPLHPYLLTEEEFVGVCQRVSQTGNLVQQDDLVEGLPALDRADFRSGHYWEDID